MKYQSKAIMIANPATPPTTPPAIAPVFEVDELVDVAAAPSYIRTGLILNKQDMNLTRRICRQQLKFRNRRSIGIYTPNPHSIVIMKPSCPWHTTEESIVLSVLEKIPGFIGAVWWVHDWIYTVCFTRTTHA